MRDLGRRAPRLKSDTFPQSKFLGSFLQPLFMGTLTHNRQRDRGSRLHHRFERIIKAFLFNDPPDIADAKPSITSPNLTRITARPKRVLIHSIADLSYRSLIAPGTHNCR